MYKCEKCDKEFLTKGYLSVHMENVHEGLKRFKCDSCGKSFSQSGELRRHVAKMHDGEKFKCELENCGKEYTSRVELKTHIRIIHGYQFKCDECEREYLDTHELNRHKFKDHKTDEYGIGNNLKKHITDHKPKGGTKTLYALIQIHLMMQMNGKSMKINGRST